MGGPPWPQQPHVLHVALAELETAHPQSVVLGGAVLLDIAARLEGGEQPKDVVLVELEPLGQLGHPQLVGVLEELLEDVERVRYRLDDVVGLLASHRSALPKRVLGYYAPAGESTSRSHRDSHRHFIEKAVACRSRMRCRLRANAVLTVRQALASFARRRRQSNASAAREGHHRHSR